MAAVIFGSEHAIRKVVFLTAPLVILVVANLQSLRPVDLRQQGRETPLSMLLPRNMLDRRGRPNAECFGLFRRDFHLTTEFLASKTRIAPELGWGPGARICSFIHLRRSTPFKYGTPVGA
jgi:hypothetical protein